MKSFVHILFITENTDFADRLKKLFNDLYAGLDYMVINPWTLNEDSLSRFTPDIVVCIDATFEQIEYIRTHYEHSSVIVTGSYIEVDKIVHSYQWLISDAPQDTFVAEIMNILKSNEAAKTEIPGSLENHIISNSLDAIIVSDRMNRIVVFNRSAECMFGYNEDEIIGKNIRVLFPDDLQSDAIYQNIKQYKRFEGVVHYISKSSQKAPCFVFVSEIRNPSDIYIGTIWMIRELSSVRAFEKKIQEQSSILDLMSDAVFVLDTSEKIVFWNSAAERLYGWSANEAASQGLLNTIFVELRNEFLKLIRHVKLHGTWKCDINLKRKDGTSVLVETKWNVLLATPNNTASILVFSSDVTAQRQAEHYALQNQRIETIGKLASGIAHDLNNILTTIRIGSDTLSLNAKNERDLSTLALLDKSIGRGAELVKKILRYSRGYPPDRKVVQMIDVVLEAAKIIHETFPKTISLGLDLEFDVPAILADPIQMHQVVMNLCINARDAMPNGGYLFITLRKISLDSDSEHTFVELSISDEGLGIPKENFDHIFTPFFTTKPSDKGTGLGLSTVKSIVQNHDGEIKVESELGKGSVFSIRLPISDVTHGTKFYTTAISNIVITNDAGFGKRVLIVEDEDTIRDMMKNALEEKLFIVDTCIHGQEAIDRISRNKYDYYDLIIMDLDLPVINGVKAIREIRKKNKTVKIIASTGDSNTWIDHYLNQDDVHGVIDKPFSLPKMFEIITKIIC